MKLKALDHVNIITSNLEASAAFYKGLLGLDIRHAPPPLPEDMALWLYDEAGRPVIHLNHTNMPKVVDRDVSGAKTGVLHHVAFECEGYEDMRAQLIAQDIAHESNEIDSIGLSQLFVEDPNGVLLELNFRGG